jgi:uncharacterized phage protein (TIGR02220 family)
MARNRMIKPEFWDDEKLAKTSRDARLTYIGLWNFSDDYGVVKGNPSWLKNHIFPYEDSMSIQKFTTILNELSSGSWILPFDHNGEAYFFIKNFLSHQVINRPSKQRNPVPPDNIAEYSVSTHSVLTDEIKDKDKLNEEENKKIYCRVVSYLNEKTGKQFKDTTKKTQDLITARLNDNFTEANFFAVIDNKASKWLKDPKMCEYLRPETLFGTKFESYLNETGGGNGTNLGINQGKNGKNETEPDFSGYDEGATVYKV